MKIIRCIALTVFVICRALSASAADETHVREAVAQIKNSDVNFQGEYIGIAEHISGASEEVRKIGVRAVPFLYEALKDPSRYVAAHVLLTHIVLKKRELSAKDWNHLVIDSFGPASDRTVKDQRVAVERFWAAQRNLKQTQNQALEPTATAVTDSAAQTPRQP
jgi:hypothetical protein